MNIPSSRRDSWRPVLTNEEPTAAGGNIGRKAVGASYRARTWVITYRGRFSTELEQSCKCSEGMEYLQLAEHLLEAWSRDHLH